MRPAEAASPVGEPELAPGDRSRRRRRRVLLYVAVAVVAVLGLGAWLLWPAGPPPLTPADVDKAVQRGLQQAQEQQRNAPPDATVADHTITPSLVIVTAQRTDPGNIDTRLGSGVVINAAGAVLTALHVVEGASRIQLAFADGTTAGATVLVTKPESDIAVLAPDQLPDLVVPAVMAGPPPVGDAVSPSATRSGSTTASPPASCRRSTAASAPRRRRAVRAHPVRRRGQPGQLAAARCSTGRAGGRHRRPRWPTRPTRTSSSGSGSPCPIGHRRRRRPAAPQQ